MNFEEYTKTKNDVNWDFFDKTEMGNLKFAYEQGKDMEEQIKLSIMHQKIKKFMTPYLIDMSKVRHYSVEKIMSAVEFANERNIDIPQKINSYKDEATALLTQEFYTKKEELGKRGIISNLLARKSSDISVYKRKSHDFDIQEAYCITNAEPKLPPAKGITFIDVLDVNKQNNFTIIQCQSKEQLEELAAALKIKDPIEYDNDTNSYKIVTNQENLLERTTKLADKLILHALLKYQKEGKSLYEFINNPIIPVLGQINIDYNAKRINDIIYENREKFDPQWILKGIKSICGIETHQAVIGDETITEKTTYLKKPHTQKMEYHKVNVEYFEEENSKSIDKVIEDKTKESQNDCAQQESNTHHFDDIIF